PVALRFAHPRRRGLLRRVAQLYPRWRVIARVWLGAPPDVHSRLTQTRRERLVEQQVIDAQPRIASPVVSKVVPKGINALVRVLHAQRIGPALRQQPLVRRAWRRLEQRVLLPRFRIVDVEVRRYDVVVAGENDRTRRVDE